MKTKIKKYTNIFWFPIYVRKFIFYLKHPLLKNFCNLQIFNSLKIIVKQFFKLLGNVGSHKITLVIGHKS